MQACSSAPSTRCAAATSGKVVGLCASVLLQHRRNDSYCEDESAGCGLKHFRSRHSQIISMLCTLEGVLLTNKTFSS